MDYDVLIVGAGFAGSEAAYALAQKGMRVGLLTTSLDSVYLPFTPVYPPFPAGSLLAEVGEAGLKGWALHSRAKYRLENHPRIHLLQLSVTQLWLEGWRVVGVRTWEGPSKSAPRVVLAVGSFLSPRLYIGDVAEEAGRLSEVAYPDLYQHLLELGFAFVPQEAAVPPQEDTPGYRVVYQVFAPGEWEPATFRLPRLEGLYAVGLCVLGQGTYAQMAEEGMRLAACSL
ncbi:FAD-binding protein [Meiothermus sp. QL-1]|uniref:FAD-dependent oxidoreductase n=1 Tax=Meiothermus sp. QL-1 TaxID=2058095 RepID=UPI000E0BE418|nr:FAD-dependent oxidoreductase [Meiothermus sp. QL-1]RDI95192.1 FAD-binding protein [Meiothermus sp. QL-1]